MADGAIQKYLNYLDLFELVRKQPRAQPERSTFFSVTGYPHRERVASRILKFFFETDEHGFYDLWFRSLTEVLADVLGGEDVDFGLLEEVREEESAGGKFMDLVLETDRYVIGIENKINAALYNPLKAYEEHLEELAKRPAGFDDCDPVMDEAEEDVEGNGEPRKHLLVVLAPSEQDLSSRNLESACSITYEQLFARVQANLGEYLEDADLHWIAIMKDFIETISRTWRSESVSIKHEDFIFENYADLMDLLNVVAEYINSLERKLSVLVQRAEEEVLGVQEATINEAVEVRELFRKLKLGMSKKVVVPRKRTGLYVRGDLVVIADHKSWENSFLKREYGDGIPNKAELWLECWFDEAGFHVAINDVANKDKKPLGNALNAIKQDENLPEELRKDIDREPSFFFEDPKPWLRLVARSESRDDEPHKALMRGLRIAAELLKPAPEPEA